MKTADEIRKQIEELRKKADELDRRERERIGAEVQKRTGKSTWQEIEPVLFPA
ncbi:MAG: hypothetical protein K5982_01520 [Selenomonadaceae bacterium]|nr:hypothetical protein [Selenomonadaceae bacterium]